MNLKALKKQGLLELANELNIEISERQRKPEIIKAIEALGAEDEELEECLVSITKKEEDRIAREAKEEREHERRGALEMKRLELGILRAQNTGEATPISREREKKIVRQPTL